MARKAKPAGKNLKATVKWAASPSANIKLQVGKKNFSIPVEARTLVGDRFVYISLPLSSAFYEMGSKKLTVAEDNDELRADMEKAMAEAKAAKKATKRGRRRRAANAPELDETLVKQLTKQIPAGYKLAVKDGKLAVVKGRVRKK